VWEEEKINNKTDVFSLGCVFFYIFSGGKRPFDKPRTPGNKMITVNNICEGRSVNLWLIEHDYPEVHNLVSDMIRRERELRPSAAQVLEHLLFWPRERRFEFLCDVGSERDVGSGAANARAVLPPSLAVGSSGGALHWDQQLDTRLVKEKTSKGQHYKYSQTTELLRFMRNVRQHPPLVGSAAEAALLLAPAAKEGGSTVFRSGEGGASETIATYFLLRYPHLLMRVHQAVHRAGWADRPSLAKYMPANSTTDGSGAPSDSEHAAAAAIVRAAVASTEEGVAAEVVDAGGAGGQEAATGDTTVEALLEKLELPQYHEKLISGGYEKVGDLKHARLEDLMDECGLKRPHAKRILMHFGVQL
jgi:hypothetical protein